MDTGDALHAASSVLQSAPSGWTVLCYLLQAAALAALLVLALCPCFEAARDDSIERGWVGKVGRRCAAVVERIAEETLDDDDGVPRARGDHES